MHVETVCQALPELLTPARCAELVEEATRQGFAAMGALYPPNYRDNDRLVRDDAALAAALYAELRHLLPPELTDRAGVRWRLHGLNPRFRFCRYRGGQAFRVHRDGAYAPAPDTRSLLTLQFYLDDAAGFEGGRTRFYDGRQGAMTVAFTPRTGHAILFDHQLWHDGEPVTAGTKHVMRTDVLYTRAEPTGGHQGYVLALLKLADGTVASASRDRTIRVGDRVLEGHTASVTALLEPEPGVLWSASRDGSVRRAGVAVLSQPAGLLSLARHGDTVVAGAADGTLHRFTLAGEPLEPWHQPGWAWALAELPDGRLASASDDGAVRLWGPDSVHPLGHGPVHALAVVSGQLVAGCADGWVVDLAGRGFKAHEGEVYALAEVGGRLASGGEDGLAHVWEGHRAIATLHHHDFVRALIKLDDRTLLTGSYDGLVRHWRI